MFDKKTVDLYKSIHAPDSLKERIKKMESESTVSTSTPFPREQENTAYKKAVFKKKYWISSLASCAAALCIIFAAVLAIPKSTKLSVNGAHAGSSPITISNSAETASLATARMALSENLSCELSIATDFDTVISISKGDLSSENASGMKTVTVNSDTDFTWSLTGFSAGDTATLTVESDGKSQTYLVYFDDAVGKWLLTEY